VPRANANAISLNALGFLKERIIRQITPPGPISTLKSARHYVSGVREYDPIGSHIACLSVYLPHPATSPRSRFAASFPLSVAQSPVRSSPVLDGSVRWYKIRNRYYSQWVGREELFERERETDPEFAIWNSCAKVCELSETLIDAD